MRGASPASTIARSVGSRSRPSPTIQIATVRSRVATVFIASTNTSGVLGSESRCTRLTTGVAVPTPRLVRSAERAGLERRWKAARSTGSRITSARPRARASRGTMPSRAPSSRSSSETNTVQSESARDTFSSCTKRGLRVSTALLNDQPCTVCTTMGTRAMRAASGPTRRALAERACTISGRRARRSRTSAATARRSVAGRSSRTSSATGCQAIPCVRNSSW